MTAIAYPPNSLGNPNRNPSPNPNSLSDPRRRGIRANGIPGVASSTGGKVRAALGGRVCVCAPRLGTTARQPRPYGLGVDASACHTWGGDMGHARPYGLGVDASADSKPGLDPERLQGYIKLRLR